MCNKGQCKFPLIGSLLFALRLDCTQQYEQRRASVLGRILICKCHLVPRGNWTCREEYDPWASLVVTRTLRLCILSHRFECLAEAILIDINTNFLPLFS